MKKTASIFALSLVTLAGFGQINDDVYEYHHMSPAVGLGVGSTSYFGELMRIEEFSAARTSTIGLNAYYLHPISNSFVGKGNIGFNKLSHWGLTEDEAVHNFSTKLYAIDLGAQYRFDNDIILDSKKAFTPFVGAGAGYAFFTSFTDIKSADNGTYHYWSDGTIRDVDEETGTANSTIISRDYDFETEISDTIGKKNGAIAYFEAGFGLKVTHNLTANFSYKHSFAFNDAIDGVVADKKNDRFNYFSVSVSYNFGKITQTADEYERDAAAKIMHQDDEDEDGVTDLFDECPHSKLGYEVDGKGCPLDGDGDGVPDADDIELDTKKGSIVDEKGRAYSDEELEVQYLLYTGQMAGHERYNEFKEKYPKLFEEYGSTGSKTIKNTTNIEEE